MNYCSKCNPVVLLTTDADGNQVCPYHGLAYELEVHADDNIDDVIEPQNDQ